MKYDLHTHTVYSRCSNLKPEHLLKAAKKAGLDGIAVTDHDTVKGGIAAKKLNQDKNFEVVVASEIKFPEIELLVFYQKKDIKTKNIFDAVDELRKQNCLIGIAHPFSFHRTKPSIRKDMKKILKELKPDFVEVFNSRTFFPWLNRKAERLADDLKIAKTGGSDGHAFFEIGKGITVFNGSLRDAIKKRKTKTQGTMLFAPPGNFVSVYAKIRNLVLK